jgi:hypothetical protein
VESGYVTDDDDKQKIAHLEQVNEELEESLGRCREMLNDYRSKLAANVNDKADPDEDEQAQSR